MEAIYTDGTYLRNNPSWHAGDAAWKAAHVLRMLERHRLSPRTVCEVGCGSGEIVRTLARALPAARFVGCDVSPDAIRISRGKATDNLDFRLGDATRTATIYDLVMAIDVFEHVEDCFGFLRGLRGKGRYKLFHIPLDLSALSVMRRDKLLAMRRRVGHIHYFTKDTALALLQDTGYRVVDHFYTAGSTDLDKLGWKTRLLKGPRRGLFAIDPDAAARWLGGYSLMVLAQ
jgi:hypothetical protein